MPERAQLELVAGASAVTAALPQGANAFVFEGEEYFDPWFGIDPFAWAVAAFINISLLNLLRTWNGKAKVLVFFSSLFITPSLLI